MLEQAANYMLMHGLISVQKYCDIAERLKPIVLIAHDEIFKITWEDENL